jgi:arsenate reductase (thioredoxin)
MIGAPKSDKTRVLFVCIHNSARSQMAEAFLNRMGGDRFEAESAGLEPAGLNPLAIEVMGETGIDISANQTNSVFDFYKQDKLYKYVVAVCDEAAEQCPVFPTFAKRLHWSFADPASFTGSHEERLAKTREVREQIRKRVEAFIKDEQQEGAA